MPRVRIPIGPQHPALKEPENFTIVLDGEQVVDVDIRIGHTLRTCILLSAYVAYARTRML